MKAYTRPFIESSKDPGRGLSSREVVVTLIIITKAKES